MRAASPACPSSGVGSDPGPGDRAGTAVGGCPTIAPSLRIPVVLVVRLLLAPGLVDANGLGVTGAGEGVPRLC